MTIIQTFVIKPATKKSSMNLKEKMNMDTNMNNQKSKVCFFDNKTANHLCILRLSIFELTLEKKQSLLFTPLNMNECPLTRDHFKRKGSSSNHHLWGLCFFFSGGVLRFILSIFVGIANVKKNMESSNIHMVEPVWLLRLPIRYS